MARALAVTGFYLRRLGWVGLAGAALIAASFAYDAAVVRPRAVALEDQLARNEQARQNAAQSDAKAETAAPGAVAQPTLAPAAAAALRRLFVAAEGAGLQLSQGEYRLTEVRDVRLRRYQLALPLAGGYPEIRGFVTEALNADPALALNAIQLRRERIESPDLDAQLSFTLYLDVGA